MSKTEITRESFAQAMRDAVAERGADYVYDADQFGDNACHYADRDGNPSCLIGLALHNLGQPLPAFENTLGAARVLRGKYGVDDYALVRASKLAQESQDNGIPWGDVLDSFEKDLGASA